MPYAPTESPIPRPVVSYPLLSSTNLMITNPSPNPGARLMQLLGNTAPSHLESAVSTPPQNPNAKMPRGRYLGEGDRAVHDVDSRLPGEAQAPQLEVTTIAKYTSDHGLVLGRQIAVNRSYIVYGLRLGNIQVLNINTALRSLLRGHTQRVTDMAFFAEDAHLLASASVDGRVFVWKIDEGSDEENRPQITGKLVIALQIVGDTESYHPHICWHSHKQEILYVGIRNRVLKIDTTKVGRGKDFTAEEPLKCPIDKLLDGVHFVGKHDGDVTALSISQWMTTRLASASNDGMVKIWDDRRQVPLATLRPHDGQPVNCVAFLTAPEHPDHINLVTAGPLNREIKVWSSTSEEGCHLPSESELWQCTQTLDLRSSSDPQLEEAFFNQVTVIPQASLIILANAKKNVIYAVHIDYGPFPASTRMDYIADFTITMPILSLVGMCESQPNGKQVVQVYCVQTMAIQQYALELALCLPPALSNNEAGGLVREHSVSRAETPVSEPVNEFITMEVTSDAPRNLSSFEGPATNPEVKPSGPPLVLTESEATLHLDALKSPQRTLERGQSSSSHGGDHDADRRSDTDLVSSNQPKEEIPALTNPRLINLTHLTTSSEILSGVISNSASPSAKTIRNDEFKAKGTGFETTKNLQNIPEEANDILNRPLEPSIGNAKAQSVEKLKSLEHSGVVELSGQRDLEPKKGLKDGCEKMEESTVLMESLSVVPGKGKEKEKEKGKEPMQAADLPSPSFVTLNPSDSNGPTEVLPAAPPGSSPPHRFSPPPSPGPLPGLPFEYPPLIYRRYRVLHVHDPFTTLDQGYLIFDPLTYSIPIPRPYQMFDPHIPENVPPHYMVYDRHVSAFSLRTRVLWLTYDPDDESTSSSPAGARRFAVRYELNGMIVSRASLIYDPPMPSSHQNDAQLRRLVLCRCILRCGALGLVLISAGFAARVIHPGDFANGFVFIFYIYIQCISYALSLFMICRSLFLTGSESEEHVTWILAAIAGTLGSLYGLIGYF